MSSLSDLFELETQEIVVKGVSYTMTSLVTADIDYVQKQVKHGKLTEEKSMAYLAFRSLAKAHPDVTWAEFNNPGMPSKYTLQFITAMMELNGYDETFRVLSGGNTGDTGPGDGDTL